MANEDRELVELFAGLDTPGVSDALDKLGLGGHCFDVVPLANYTGTVVGPAFTGKYVPASNPPGDGRRLYRRRRRRGRGGHRQWRAHGLHRLERHHDPICGRVVSIGQARVVPRDIVVADANGVVVVPRGRAREVAEAAYKIEAIETKICEAIAAGQTLKQARDTDEPAV